MASDEEGEATDLFRRASSAFLRYRLTDQRAKRRAPRIPRPRTTPAMTPLSVDDRPLSPLFGAADDVGEFVEEVAAAPV